MKYTLLIALLSIMLPFTIFAQTASEPPEMDSDRPNFTQGATVVPHKYIQLETGVEFRHDESFRKEEKVFLYPSTLIRLGILKNAELRINFDLEQEKQTPLMGPVFPGDETNEKGFDNVQIGTKIALLKGKGVVPSVAFLAHLTLPIGNKEFRPPHAAPGAQLLFDSKITEKLELQYNLGYRKHMSEGDYRGELIYSVSALYKFTDAFIIFAEYQASKPITQSPENSVATGLLYKIIPNLQVDVLFGAAVSEAAPDFYTGAGVTWRLPR